MQNKLKTKVPDLTDFNVDKLRGFLPKNDPLKVLPKRYAEWERIGAQLPKLLVAGRVKDEVKKLKPISIDQLKNSAQRERAMMILSFIGHAYVWGEKEAADTIPRGLAIPWSQLAEKLGRPPVLSYASYALYNWQRINPKGPVALGNIALLQNFLAGIDEEWFILIHVDIEAKAAAALSCLIKLKIAVEKNNFKEATKLLRAISDALSGMYATLDRMPENCDPYIYYNRVRPYIFGWKNQPSLPNGVRYEGVKRFAGKSQMFRGETGSQSSIIPALDAALGVEHENDPLRAYLQEMREYMPPSHNAFISWLESGINIRKAVSEAQRDFPQLVDEYNACITWIEKFRSLHLEYAIRYIQRQKQTDPSNPNEIGTGGTPFVPYLKKHRDETGKHLV